MAAKAGYVLRVLSVLVVFVSSMPVQADVSERIRVGVLKYGTINWEMDVIRRHDLSALNGLDMEIVPLGSPQALLVALQGGAVDAVVGDWLWVVRQREFQRHYYFYPHSTAAGVLVVNPARGITSVRQLKGKKIGIAGGKVNKNWQLFRAYTRRTQGFDIVSEADVKFAAPPMLNALLLNERLDAVLNFWHYSSELNEQGMTSLLTMRQLLEGLGVAGQVPLLGWIFDKHWADHHRATVNNFLATSYQAKMLMLESDREWHAIEPLIQRADGPLANRLRDAYREGIPTRFGALEKQAMQKLFTILSHEGGNTLVGNFQDLPQDIFWQSTLLKQPRKEGQYP